MAHLTLEIDFHPKAQLPTRIAIVDRSPDSPIPASASLLELAPFIAGTLIGQSLQREENELTFRLFPRVLITCTRNYLMLTRKQYPHPIELSMTFQAICSRTHRIAQASGGLMMNPAVTAMFESFIREHADRMEQTIGPQLADGTGVSYEDCKRKLADFTAQVPGMFGGGFQSTIFPHDADVDITKLRSHYRPGQTEGDES